MKKIVILNGSPHEHGCTAALAGEIEKELKNRGAEISAYYLNGLNIKGCQGCFSCIHNDGRCATGDDMQEILRDISAADGIVLATPVYMWQMTSQLKTAVDRMFSFLRPGHESGLAPGKKVFFAVTQGREDTDLFLHYFEHAGRNLQYIGFGEYRILIAGGTHKPEEVLCQSDILEEACALCGWLCE